MDKGGYIRRLIEAEEETLDRAGAAGGFVHVEQDGVHADVALGDREFRRHAVEKSLNDALLLHADDGIVRAGHADVGDVSGAPGEDALVGGGDVRVRADDHGYFAVEIPAHGLFFGRGFSVHVHDDHFHVGRNFGELAV